MSGDYEIRLAGRVVSTRRSVSAREAAYDYVRSLGCRMDEISCLAFDAVVWRGAVYRAVPVGAAAPGKHAG